MTIFERALELVRGCTLIGLGSGRAARAFIAALGEQVRNGSMSVHCVATSSQSAEYAKGVGIPLINLHDVPQLDVTIDGADEVDPHLNLIKGYGRALVREKIVAASSRQLIILVGTEKVVARLGDRGNLPVEIVPFALPLCQRRLRELGCEPVLYCRDDQPFLTDNGNHILDCGIKAIDDPQSLEIAIRAIPGVVGTGLFLGMANTVLIGANDTFELLEERQRASAG